MPGAGPAICATRRRIGNIPSMTFARRVFFWSGVYGIAVLLPHYFLEARIGMDHPPAVTHPEYFYGFLAVGLAFQVLFLAVSRDPVRYRAMMVPSMLEKFGFAASVLALYALGRVPALLFVPATADFLLGLLFVVAYLKTPKA
jgi:hypothetical protein